MAIDYEHARLIAERDIYRNQADIMERILELGDKLYLFHDFWAQGGIASLCQANHDLHVEMEETRKVAGGAYAVGYENGKLVGSLSGYERFWTQVAFVALCQKFEDLGVAVVKAVGRHVS